MPQLFLYEPRMLMRSAIKAFTHDTVASPLHEYPLLTPLIDDICNAIYRDAVVMVGVGGAGIHLEELFKLLRTLRCCRVKTIVWLPSGYPHVAQLLRALGVQHLLLEEFLDTCLVDAIGTEKQTDALFAGSGDQRQKKIVSQTELDILLLFAKGLSAKEIARLRGCSYKTIFAWKYHLRAALMLQNKEHWLEALVEIDKLSTDYH